MKLVAIPVSILSALALFACGSGSGSSGTPTVSATTGILADITRQVAGDDIEVEQVIPEGSSPHDFELSAQDRAEIEDSVLLVHNGAELESGVPVDEIGVDQFALADNVGELLAADEGGDDPHLWMDPTRVAAAAPALADALAAADPDNADTYRKRAAAYAVELTDIDSEIGKLLASLPAADRELVTSHDALGYFADRYGFEIVATAFPASGPEAEASAGRINDVEQAVTATGVPTLFAEQEDDPEVLELVADETGVAVTTDLLVESLGNAGSYVEMLRHDARLIADGLAPTGDG